MTSLTMVLLSLAGIIHLKDGLLERFPVEDYLDLFELAAYHIQEGILGNTSGDHSQRHIITGNLQVIVGHLYLLDTLNYNN